MRWKFAETWTFYNCSLCYNLITCSLTVTFIVDGSRMSRACQEKNLSQMLSTHFPIDRLFSKDRRNSKMRQNYGPSLNIFMYKLCTNIDRKGVPHLSLTIPANQRDMRHSIRPFWFPFGEDAKRKRHKLLASGCNYFALHANYIFYACLGAKIIIHQGPTTLFQKHSNYIGKLIRSMVIFICVVDILARQWLYVDSCILNLVICIIPSVKSPRDNRNRLNER